MSMTSMNQNNKKYPLMAWTMMSSKSTHNAAYIKFRDGLYIDKTKLVAKVGTHKGIEHMCILGVKLVPSPSMILNTTSIRMDDEEKKQLMRGRLLFSTYKLTIVSALELVARHQGFWCQKWKRTDLMTGPLYPGYSAHMLHVAGDYRVVFAMEPTTT